MPQRLKSETSARESYRKKLRNGKSDNDLPLKDKKRGRKQKRAQRKKMYAEAARATQTAGDLVNRAGDENDDGNVADETISKAAGMAKSGLYSVKSKAAGKGRDGYGAKIHGKRGTATAKSEEELGREWQRNRTKREMVLHAKKMKERENTVGSLSKRFVDRAEDMAGRIAENVIEYLESHPAGVMLALVCLFIIVIMTTGLSSCSMLAGGTTGMTWTTSFTADDDEILAADTAYGNLESALRDKMSTIETDYPGYDEYRYSVAEINHNSFELAALLTVLYEDYTVSEVAEMLNRIYDYQYSLSITETTEIRTRTETEYKYRWVWDANQGKYVLQQYTEEIEVQYEYHILNVTLANRGITKAVNSLGLTDDQRQRYEALLEMKGNKPHLFGDDIYTNITPDDDLLDYDIPADLLTDEQFANMIREANKHLGTPYVWGGYSPSSGFDCSGFVSYVLNHCGNGWNVGRLTANGLLGKCTRVSSSQAQPGDLIFFQGTNSTPGASHVGIYVGNGMMIHCGNPVQYASLNTSYWQSHFLTYGRLNL